MTTTFIYNNNITLLKKINHRAFRIKLLQGNPDKNIRCLLRCLLYIFKKKTCRIYII